MNKVYQEISTGRNVYWRNQAGFFVLQVLVSSSVQKTSRSLGAVKLVVTQKYSNIEPKIELPEESTTVRIKLEHKENLV